MAHCEECEAFLRPPFDWGPCAWCFAPCPDPLLRGYFVNGWPLYCGQSCLERAHDVVMRDDPAYARATMECNLAAKGGE